MIGVPARLNVNWPTGRVLSGDKSRPGAGALASTAP
jgi:hypothetical protein